jgi:amino acid adenylation domain-containing protein
MTAGAADNISEEVFVFPASFAQQRLWFLDQLFPGTSFYNVPIVIRLTGVLNLAALEKSFNEIVRRHEVLRTTFGIVEGQPVQLIAPHLTVSLPLINLQSLPVSERETALQQLIAQKTQQPFNLATGPLLRVTLLQLDQTEYVLAIALHHIVFDEWSSAVLIRELGLLYTAFSAGKPSPLPFLPIQYADFAHWQREWLQGETRSSQLSYWRSQLHNLSTLEIESNFVKPEGYRSEYSRPQAQSYRGATGLLELPKDLSQALLALSQQENVTLFMTLLAAFQTLLHRYTGQTDIAVGSPIANRNRRELEELIGFFANSLILRTDLSGNPTFRELLLRVRQVAVGAYEHQDLPFEKLVEDLHPERQGSRNPLFQAVFALQNAPMEQLELPGLTLSPFKLETTTTRFDLELYLWECGENFRNLWGDSWQQSEGLRGVLVYSTDLFEPNAIARMLQHFQTLLAGAVANPDTHLADLPLLSPAEQYQLLVEWNQTKRNYPECLCHQLFEDWAAQNPDAVAVQFGGRQFTYQQLNSGSNQLAHYLRKLGVGSETLVGVCMEPSPIMIAALLGILKAGGAYVPLDPTYPPERLRFMLEDAQISVLLTQQDFRLGTSGEDSQINQLCAKSKLQNLKVVYLDQDWEAIASFSEENPINQIDANSLAYVVYTSGSTGTPKGVAVPHRAINQLVCNTNYIALKPSDKVALCSNISFDAATFEIWGALLNGAQLVGINREIILSPQDFAQEIRQQEISVLFLTTALFNQMAREMPSSFRSLRYLLFGGEAVDARCVQAVMKEGAPQHLLHVYGPTENTTFTCWYEVQDVAATSIPIGRAIANTQIYLLDTHLKPVPIGVTGEIHISGDGLARGYLNRPDLTAERFIPNPFKKAEVRSMKDETENPLLTSFTLHPSLRLYKTGDLARYLPDGNLEFVGRTDDQVKLRGFRIELGEMEMVLKEHPAVQETVVMLRDDAAGVAGDRSLVAYVVPNRELNLTTSELRDFLKTKLPNFMLPTAFVVLETLPLTPNGKIDRKALPAPNVVIGLPGNQLPRTSVEANLVQIWAEILKQQVGISDNFFELGGHSLLATQLVSRIRDRFGVQVPLRTLFETPTIIGMAQYIEAISAANKDFKMAGSGTIASQNREEVEF